MRSSESGYATPSRKPTSPAQMRLATGYSVGCASSIREPKCVSAIHWPVSANRRSTSFAMEASRPSSDRTPGMRNRPRLGSSRTTRARMSTPTMRRWNYSVSLATKSSASQRARLQNPTLESKMPHGLWELLDDFRAAPQSRRRVPSRRSRRAGGVHHLEKRWRQGSACHLVEALRMTPVANRPRLSERQRPSCCRLPRSWANQLRRLLRGPVLFRPG